MTYKDQSPKLEQNGKDFELHFPYERNPVPMGMAKPCSYSYLRMALPELILETESPVRDCPPGE